MPQGKIEMQPNIEIDVSEQTGVWTTDGFPMVYIPRHFLVNIHNATEQAMGRDAYKAVLDEAGARSAFYWCEREAQARNLDGPGVFKHYLDRLSARGWGQFEIASLSSESGTAEIVLRNSLYVLQAEHPVEQPVCYMFEGFFVGGFQSVLKQGGKSATVDCREVQCAASGADACIFSLTSH